MSKLQIVNDLEWFRSERERLIKLTGKQEDNYRKLEAKYKYQLILNAELRDKK